MGQWHAAEEYDGQVREITFRTLCNSPMCPPDTAMTEYQHSVLTPDKKMLVWSLIWSFGLNFMLLVPHWLGVMQKSLYLWLAQSSPYKAPSGLGCIVLYQLGIRQKCFVYGLDNPPITRCLLGLKLGLVHFNNNATKITVVLLFPALSIVVPTLSTSLDVIDLYVYSLLINIFIIFKSLPGFRCLKPYNMLMMFPLDLILRYVMFRPHLRHN